MIITIVLISVFALIVSVFFALFARKVARHSAMFDYNHIIQKRTSTLFFDVNGFLLSDNDSTNREHALGSLRTGDNISSFTQNPDMATYLKTCARYRGNLNYKVEEIENSLVKRTPQYTARPKNRPSAAARSENTTALTPPAWNLWARYAAHTHATSAPNTRQNT